MGLPLFAPRRPVVDAPLPTNQKLPKVLGAGADHYARGREVGALLLGTTALFLALALASYAGDATPPDAGPATVGANWVGPVGEAAARSLVTLLGVVAWIVPVELALLGVPFITNRRSTITPARLGSDFAIAFLAAALVQVGWPTAKAFGNHDAAGALGELFGELSRSLFSTVGSILVGFALLSLVLIGRSTFSFIALVRLFGALGSQSAASTAKGAGALADAWRKARALDAEDRAATRPRIELTPAIAGTVLRGPSRSLPPAADLPGEATAPTPDVAPSPAAPVVARRPRVAAAAAPLRNDDPIADALADRSAPPAAVVSSAPAAAAAAVVAAPAPASAGTPADARPKARARRTREREVAAPSPIVLNDVGPAEVTEIPSEAAPASAVSPPSAPASVAPASEEPLSATPSPTPLSAGVTVTPRPAPPTRATASAAPGRMPPAPANPLTPPPPAAELEPVIVDTRAALDVVHAPARAVRDVVISLEKGFELPSIEFLSPQKIDPTTIIDKDVLFRNADLLIKTLADYGVSGKVEEILPGPTVTTYEVSPAAGTKVSKVASLADDLALALAKKVRIIAPIPGKNRIGFELPNEKRQPGERHG